MKQYQFSLKDECMRYVPNFFDVTKEEIPVPKAYLSSFTDGKIYNESEFTVGFDCAVYSLGCCSGGNELCDKCHIAIPKQKVDNNELSLLNLGFEIKFIKNELLPANTAMVSKDIYEMLKNNYQK